MFKFTQVVLEDDNVHVCGVIKKQMDRDVITLDLEEQNELLFKVVVEGTDRSSAKVRLVCESEDFSYMFNGYGTDDEGVVQFVLPNMKSKLKEGTYNARVEVLVDGRYFAPVEFDIEFKNVVKVVAEAIQLPKRPKPANVNVTASPISVARKPAPPIVEASKPSVKRTLAEQFGKK